MTLFEITRATAHPDHAASITWADGAKRHDRLPAGHRPRRLVTPPRDGEYFAATMIVLPDGAGLTWPGEIDFAADALRRHAFPVGLPDQTG